MNRTGHTSRQDLSILLIDDDELRVQAFTSALQDSRYKIRHLATSNTSLLREVDNLQPDIIVVDVESPTRDIFDSLHTISSFNPKPVVMFSEQQDTEMINLSIKSGVSAYVAADTDPSRVRAILDVAVARFHEYQKLKDELHQTKSKLQARKQIDLAKRLLMESKKISEQQAYSAMRKMAMDAGQKIEDVAKTLISVLHNLDRGSQ